MSFFTCWAVFTEQIQHDFDPLTFNLARQVGETYETFQKLFKKQLDFVDFVFLHWVGISCEEKYIFHFSSWWEKNKWLKSGWRRLHVISTQYVACKCSSVASSVHGSLPHVLISLFSCLVVDKHDFEPSHRCMRCRKAQLITVHLCDPALEQSHRGWAPLGAELVASPHVAHLVAAHCDTGALTWIRVVASRAPRSRMQEAGRSQRRAGGRRSRSTACPKWPTTPWRTWERWATG